MANKEDSNNAWQVQMLIDVENWAGGFMIFLLHVIGATNLDYEYACW
jgi:hypothetical protein